MTGHMLVVRESLAAASSLAPSPPVYLQIKALPSSHTPLSQDFPSLSVQYRSPNPTFGGLRAAATRATLCLSVLNTKSKEAATPDSGFSRKRLAIFVSGGGSNFRTLHQASLQNKIYGDFVLVVSDKPACKACGYAKDSNIPIVEYPHNKVANSGLSPAKLVSVLRDYEIDIVLLAGYLKLLPQEVIQAFPRAILNIHPALLPAFGGKGYYGRKVHEAVIKSGARYSGPTIHFVDEKYDHGSIVAQRVVPVLAYDTADDLAARVLKEEHNFYPNVVAALCEDRIFWREDGVPLIRRSWNEAEYD